MHVYESARCLSTAHSQAHMQTSPVYLQKFLERYSLVVKILFPCHSVDGYRHKREALDGDRKRQPYEVLSEFGEIHLSFMLS